MPTRKYEQRLRAETAEETRRRILDALYERLRERPAEPVSVEEVARAGAGLALHDLSDLRLARRALRRPRRRALPHAASSSRSSAHVATPTARESLRGGDPRRRGDVSPRTVDVIRVLYSMAQLEAAAAGGTVQRLEEAPRQGMTELAQKLADQGAAPA